MKLPNTAYEPDFIGYGEVSFFPRRNSNDESICNVRLPKWFAELIDATIKRAEEKGRKEALQNVRKALGI